MIRTYQKVTLSGSFPMYDDAVQLTCQDKINFLTTGRTNSPTLHIHSGGTTLDATRFQQSIIVTHQQVALYLL